MAINASGIQGNPSYAEKAFQQTFGINPILYGQNIQYNSLQVNNLVNSDAVVDDDRIGNQLTNPGNDIYLPFDNDLYGDPEVWNDDNNIEPDSFTTGQERAVKLYQDKAFAFTDFAQLVDLSNPLERINSRIGDFWTRANTKAVISILKGTFANPQIANTNVYDGSDKTFNLLDFQKAKSRLGAYQNSAFSTLFVHPTVYSQMQAENYITVVGNDTPLSNAAQPISMYNGMRVIMDDQLPIDENGVATSYLAGKGSIMFSAESVQGVELYRNPLEAGGRTSIVTKRVITGHVHGTTVTEGFPSMGLSVDDYANPDMWDCVVNPEYIHVVAYRSKIGDGYKGSLPDEKAIADAQGAKTVARNNSRKRGSSSSASSSAASTTTTSSSASSSSSSK